MRAHRGGPYGTKGRKPWLAEPVAAIEIAYRE